MARRREYEDEDDDDDDYGNSRAGCGKRRKSDFIDDVAEEDEEEDEEYGEDDEDYGGGGSRRRGGKAARKASGAGFFELEADVDTDAEEDGEDEDARRMHRRPLLSCEDDQEDVQALERRIQEKFARNHTEYDDDNATEVERQALLPSIHDPKLWMVKCAIGHEREVATCIMQKCIDRGSELQIRSAIAFDHLKNYIYIEADKEAHVKETCKGMRNIYAGSKILLTNVLSVEIKAIDLSRDTWVRMKIGTYKRDPAKEGREVPKKTFARVPRFINVHEARKKGRFMKGDRVIVTRGT